MSPEDLYVITPICNPARFATRDRLFKEFRARMERSGVALHVVELAFGDRPFEHTETGNPKHTQLRTSHELWHKENMLNAAIARLPQDWKYVAWVDADITFVREDWPMETIQLLQHHNFVQLFQTAIDLGPNGETLNTFHGFAWCYNTGKPFGQKLAQGSYYYKGAGQSGIYWHPGFAWAARREAVNHCGGLIDKAILGAGDHHMAMSLVGMGKQSVPTYIHRNYKDYILRWQDRCERHVRRNIGFVPGTVAHHWHGRKADRKYWDRWQVLKKANFDPVADLKRDSQGLYQLVDCDSQRGIILRDGIRNYFRGRNEDSIDL